uniref:Beta-N-acetylhexosaminidase n=1 Tax=Beutenbergia cavernae (strain ATCC BAA-8 / DSM 12333 / CCUG 43141 / JCM 11478 / NBRC 16432 / NCIMB 13614 / HKI 0122) TaxID=471853 RepID=UPI000645458D
SNADLSLEQRVGQLFMVGTDAATAEQVTLDAITASHVGNVFLAGRSNAGVDATAAVVEQLTAAVTDEATGGVPLLVATDQEGGNVQVLRGPGFSDIPTALDQGALDPATLQADATTWGAELAASGINLNLAPVMDVVASPEAAAANPPIGYFHREFGYDAETVASHANAFSAGMRASGVETVIKHFPGLGRVTENTDTTAGVVDDVTTADDASVQAFAAGIDAGAAFVMTSTAVYSQIDPDAPAAFSREIVSDLLRGQLGFDGVVVTDDVSAAEQVQAWSPADRAILAIEAGTDIVLVSADPSIAAEMVAAVVAKAQADPDFAAIVDDAARRVLAAKGVA